MPRLAGRRVTLGVNRIPSQLTHAVSAVYSLRGSWGLDLALDANVTDERVYDLLGVQKPGRAAFLKATVSTT